MVPSMTTLEVTCADICRWQLGIDEDDGALTPIACCLIDMMIRWTEDDHDAHEQW